MSALWQPGYDLLHEIDSPGVLRPIGASDNYVHVVMPMFVQW